MAKGTGVLPDGSSETFQERCAKGVSHTAYAKAEYWAENKYVRVYSIMKPKFTDFHYYIFFPTRREVEDGHSNWKAKWIFTNQDKKNDDPKITLRQGLLCTFFILDGDSFSLDHVKKFRHEFDTREAMNDLYQYYRKFFIKEPLWDDVGCLFNAYSKHKLQVFEDSIEIDQFLARKKERMKEEDGSSTALTTSNSQGGLKLSLSSLKGVIKSSSAMSPRSMASESQKSPRGINTKDRDRQQHQPQANDSDHAIMLGSPYSSNQRLKTDVITSNHNVLTHSNSNVHSIQPKPFASSTPGSSRQQRDESLLLNPLPAHFGTSPRQHASHDSNSTHPNAQPGQPFVVNSNLTINLDSNNTRAGVNSSPHSPRGNASQPLNIRSAQSPNSPPVSPRYNVSPMRQPTQGLNSNGFANMTLNSNSRQGANSPSSPSNASPLRDSAPDLRRNLSDNPNATDRIPQSPPRSRAPYSPRSFTQGVSPTFEDLVVPTLEGNIVLKNITEDERMSPRKNMVLSANRKKLGES